MGKCIRHQPEKTMSIAFRNGDLKGIIEGLPVRQVRYHRRCQVRIVAMTQRRLKGVLLGFASEVIAARAKVSRAEDHSLREFPFHVEVILQRVRELRVIACRENVERLGQGSILWVEELRENEFL